MIENQENLTDDELLTLTAGFLDKLGDRLNCSWTESEEAHLASAIGEWLMTTGHGNEVRGTCEDVSDAPSSEGACSAPPGAPKLAVL